MQWSRRQRSQGPSDTSVARTSCPMPALRPPGGVAETPEKKGSLRIVHAHSHRPLHRREVGTRLHTLPVLVAQSSSPTTRVRSRWMFSRPAAIAHPALVNATSVTRRSPVRSAPGLCHLASRTLTFCCFLCIGPSLRLVDRAAAYIHSLLWWWSPSVLRGWPSIFCGTGGFYDCQGAACARAM